MNRISCHFFFNSFGAAVTFAFLVFHVKVSNYRFSSEKHLNKQISKAPTERNGQHNWAIAKNGAHSRKYHKLKANNNSRATPKKIMCSTRNGSHNLYFCWVLIAFCKWKRHTGDRQHFIRKSRRAIIKKSWKKCIRTRNNKSNVFQTIKQRKKTNFTIFYHSLCTEHPSYIRMHGESTEFDGWQIGVLTHTQATSGAKKKNK